MLIFSIILLLVLGFGVKLYAQDSTQTKPTTELAGNLTTISADTLVSDSISAQIQQIKDEYQEAIAENTNKMDSLKLWLQILSGVVGLLLLLIAIVFYKLSVTNKSVDDAHERIERRKTEIGLLKQNQNSNLTTRNQLSSQGNKANQGGKRNKDNSPYMPKQENPKENTGQVTQKDSIEINKEEKEKVSNNTEKKIDTKEVVYVKPSLRGDDLILVPTTDSSSANFKIEYPSSQKNNTVINAELVPNVDFANLKTMKVEFKKSLLEVDTTMCDWSTATDYTILDFGKAIKTPDAWKKVTAIKIKLLK